MGVFGVVKGWTDPVALAEWLADEFQRMKQKREPTLSNYVPSPAGQHLAACMNRCSSEGLQFGSKEYWDCVRSCLVKKNPGR